MLDLLLCIVAVLYAVKVVLFKVGIAKAQKIRTVQHTPSVSVIVAARDEEQNISACLDALAQIDYPKEQFEIIVVDDQSTDRTGEIIREHCATMTNLVPMTTSGQVDSLFGKANAVAQAIDKASGEIILTSDADCLVPVSWIKDTVKYYTKDVGCVCGFTLLKYRSILSGMQSLDWAYLLSIASAGVGWKYPLSAVGNNMSFRKKAYDDVGGYVGVGPSVTEDFVLFKAIGYQTKWSVAYPLDPRTLVWSEPCAGWKEIFAQKKRWARGGIKIHFLGYLIMTIGFLMSALVLVYPWIGTHIWYWLGALGVKWIADAFLLQSPLGALRQKKLFKYYIVYELYYVLYVVLLPFVLLFTGRVIWKGRKL